MGSDINTKKGFTIIELSLSIVFIAILSITIVLIINNTVSSYRRGIMLNQINTTGMDLVDDMRLAVQNSSTDFVEEACEKAYASYGSTLRTKCVEGKAKYFVSLTKTATVRLKGNVIGDNIPVFGAFCAGSFSYIWNSGYFEPNNGYEVEKGVERAELKYKSKAGGKEESILSEDFRLLKVIDENRLVCASMVNERYEDKGGSLFDLSTKAPLAEEPIELLPGGGNNLVLYNLMSNVVEDAGGGMLYSVSFILGSIQGGININATSNYCATSEDAELENLEYCSVNKFNFATLVAGRKKDNEL